MYLNSAEIKDCRPTMNYDNNFDLWLILSDDGSYHNKLSAVKKVYVKNFSIQERLDLMKILNRERILVIIPLSSCLVEKK